MKGNNRKQGELEIIRYLRKRFPKRRSEILKGIGDDAMILRDGYVISTDSFQERTHFDLNYFSFYALGFHSMAAALSDLAAMGAAPIAALISLSVSRGTGMRAIRELYDGFDEMARKYKCDIAGGDIVKSVALGINITVIGRARKPLLRSGALPGDSLYVTNFLGLAETGRIALQEKSPVDQYPDAIKRHLYPEPRINEALSIAKYATACIDTSDGLSTDAFHIAEESNVRIVIDAAHIPIHAEVGRLSNLKGIDPTRFILSAGEDFELLFAARKLPRISHMKIFKIGSVMKGRGLYLKVKGQLRRIQPAGYEHIAHK